MAKVRISDVAREAGVSLGTVSNALNHPDKVKPDTLETIQDAIERLGYVPNQAARQLAGSESRVFGLVLPRLDHAFSLQIANGVQLESRANGYDVLIASAGNDDILESRYMRYFLGAHIAGILVQPMASTAWEPPVSAVSVPTVYLDVHGRTFDNYIAADNEAQGRLMVEHAASCGARSVAVIGEPAFMQLVLRTYGMREGAHACGLGIEFIGRGDWNSAEDGFDLGRELARRSPDERPDFVIGLTDVLAAGAIEGLMEEGCTVPGDVMVAGCDGNPLAWGGPVSLTTIASPGVEIGRRGVRALLSQIQNPDAVHERNELVAPELMVRMSTAGGSVPGDRAPVEDINLGEYLSVRP